MNPLNVGNAGHVLLSYYMFCIDPATYEIEIYPLRGLETHWNVLKWLEQNPCTDCLSVAIVGPTPNGTLLVDVQITHPFENPALTGYDVRGIAIFNASANFPDADLTYSDRTLGDGELVNADGYTTLYNTTTIDAGPNGMQGFTEGKFGTKTLPDSLLNGFKRFNSEDAGNTFLPGDTVTVSYEIDMPDGPFVIGYAIDASWKWPDGGHMEEPWKIEFEVIPIDDGLTEAGGQAIIEITYYPYQHYLNYYSPRVECPALFDGNQSAAWWDGDIYGVSPQVYRATIENAKLAVEGEYPVLISCEAVEIPDNTPWLDLTSYQISPIAVSEVPVVAHANAIPNPQGVGDDVIFSGSDSFDPDGGEITLYEWDWDNDGIYDAEGVEASHSWDTPGVFLVQLRVTDDQSDTGILEEPLKVWIEQGFPSNPVDVTPSGLDFDAMDIAISGDYAYVTETNAGLHVIDISTPESASIIDSIAMSTASRVDITNDLACVQEENSIHLIDVSDPWNAYEAGYIPTNVTSFACNNDYLYVLDWTFLRTYDINPPEEASQVNQVLCGYLTDWPGVELDIGNNQAIVVFHWLSDPMIYSGGMQFYDVSNPPLSPKIQELIGIPGGPTFLRNVRACDSYAIAGRTYGNHVWDITDPGHATIIATIDELGWLRDAAFTECEGFALAGNSECAIVYIFDMAPPEDANQIGSITLPGTLRSIDYSNGYAYFTVADSGLQIYKLW